MHVLRGDWHLCQRVLERINDRHYKKLNTSKRETIPDISNSYKDYNLWSGGPTIFHKTFLLPSRRKGCIDKSVLLEVTRESNYPIKYTKML